MTSDILYFLSFMEGKDLLSLVLRWIILVCGAEFFFGAELTILLVSSWCLVGGIFGHTVLVSLTSIVDACFQTVT